MNLLSKIKKIDSISNTNFTPTKSYIDVRYLSKIINPNTVEFNFEDDLNNNQIIITKTVFKNKNKKKKEFEVKYYLDRQKNQEFDKTKFINECINNNKFEVIIDKDLHFKRIDFFKGDKLEHKIEYSPYYNTDVNLSFMIYPEKN